MSKPISAAKLSSELVVHAKKIAPGRGVFVCVFESGATEEEANLELPDDITTLKQLADMLRRMANDIEELSR